jgi:hypothetical protein
MRQRGHQRAQAVIELYVVVSTIVNKWPTAEINGKRVSWEGTQRMDPKMARGDKFAMLNADGAASVKVAVEEKVSGPSGSFSSISVRVEISSRCNQDEKTIAEAHETLFTEGLRALEHYASPALAMLLDHIKKV